MTHFSTTFGMADSGDTTHFGSLEFLALPPVGMWVLLVFEPSQAFLFGSLDFVADRLGILRLCKEALVPAPVGGVPSIGSGTHDDFDDEAPTLHSEQTLCSNPVVSNICSVIYSLFTIFHRLSRAAALFAPQPRMTGSPTASCPPWTRTLRGSEGCWRRPLTRSNSWGWRAMLPIVFSTSWMTMLRVTAPASVTWRLATVHPWSALWRTLQDSHRW